MKETETQQEYQDRLRGTLSRLNQEAKKNKSKQAKEKKPQSNEDKEFAAVGKIGGYVWEGFKSLGRALVGYVRWSDKVNKGRWGQVAPQLAVFFSLGFLACYVYYVLLR